MDVETLNYPILERLDRSLVEYRLFTHKPVFTVEEGEELLKHIPGRGSKNLFLRDKKGIRFYLLTVCEEKRVDLASLGELFQSGRLSFGSPEKLKKYLSLEPGSVTPLGLLFDENHEVQAFIDEDLIAAETMQIHPMKNDATIVLSGSSLLNLLQEDGRVVKTISVPTTQGV